MSSKISDGFLLNLLEDAITELCLRNSKGTNSHADSAITSESKIVF